MVIRKSEHFFYARDGQALKSKKEMLEWVKNVDDNTFSGHVNSAKNDFVDWTKEILKDGPLSKRLKQIDNREGMIAAIEERVENKSKKRKKGVIDQIKDAITNG